ncbi:protein of unknown function [Nitrospira defluvii]|uniref:Uncharacterized protein n=1 Tax=Nitrospira defluvii TaxID=330214 RepID=D8PIQ2_9BACT|nr:protein of unknown function [Nitrospira defluvii]
MASCIDWDFTPRGDVLTVPFKPDPAIPRRLYLFGTNQRHTTTLHNAGLFIDNRDAKGGSAEDRP